MTSFSGFPHTSSIHDRAASCFGDPVAQRCRQLVLQTLADHNVEVDDKDLLNLIVRAALEAQSLLFAAALYDPGERELFSFFENFILSCVAPSDSTEAR